MGMMIHRRREGHLHYPKVEDKVETHDEPVIEEKEKEAVYTLDEINRLPFFSLKSLAAQQGIDVKGKKGNDLKAELIEKLGL